MRKIGTLLLMGVGFLTTQLSATAGGICPQGSLVILCHQGSHGISLTGCYSGGLTYLCTRAIRSCDGVNARSLVSSPWRSPIYHASAMRFVCPKQGVSRQAKRLTLSTSAWQRAASRVGSRMCPTGRMPVLCHQQTRGVSLIGCYGSGLRYLCTRSISSCNQIGNVSAPRVQWVQARYDDSRLIFACPGTRSVGPKQRVMMDANAWNALIHQAQ